MEISGISGATAANTSVNKDEFLRLFVAQLKNQSPMDPLKGHEFIAQLAQFSSLEQLTNLNTSFEDTLKYEQLLGAGNLIGRTATYIDTSSGKTIEGVIEGTTISNGSASVVIQNRDVPISDLTGIF